jgi:hypothetical protein
MVWDGHQAVDRAAGNGDGNASDLTVLQVASSQRRTGCCCTMVARAT